MYGERNDNSINIFLSRKEVFQVMDGKTVGERLGLTYPDAKVEVIPLSMREDDTSKMYRYSEDRLERAQSTLGKAFYSTNGDLLFYLPDITLRDVRLTGVTFPRESISPLTTDQSNIRDTIIPQRGVRLLFGGSLLTVDIPQYFDIEN